MDIKRHIRTVIKATAVSLLFVVVPCYGDPIYDGAWSVKNDSIKVVTVATEDIVYDPFSERIYASVPSSVGDGGNSIAVIDPRNGTIEASIFVGSEPRKLAVSDDGKYLYVALEGSASVRRLDLASQSAGLEFPVGPSPRYGPLFVEDMEVQPGNASVLAISRRNKVVTPRHSGVAVYEDGVQRRVETPGHTGSNVVEFCSDSQHLYGYNNASTEYGFRTMEVDTSGVSVTKVTENVIYGFNVDIECEQDAMYATTGRLVDPLTHTLLGTFGAFGLVRPVPEANRVYFLARTGYSTVEISAFDIRTFIPVGTLEVPKVSGVPRSFIRWGERGLAFNTTGKQIFLIREAKIIPTSVEESRGRLPMTPLLSQNRPNPFKQTTTIEFAVPIAQQVTLRLFDTLGREVRKLVDGYTLAGRHAVTLDSGHLPSGVYFYSLETSSYVETRKLTLLK